MRLLLSQPNAMRDLPDGDRVASLLLGVEARCTIQSRRLAGLLTDEEWVAAMTELTDLERTVTWVGLSRPVLRRASQSFGIAIRALDAIQLASALAARRRFGDGLQFATHDVRQGQAARTLGFDVIGIHA